MKESSHEGVDDEVARAVYYKGQMHEACKTDHPAGRFEVRALVDAWTHEELSEVDDESWEVAKEKYDDDADEDAGQVHLVVGRGVSVVSWMSVPNIGTNISLKCLNASLKMTYHSVIEF